MDLKRSKRATLGDQRVAAQNRERFQGYETHTGTPIRKWKRMGSGSAEIIEPVFPICSQRLFRFLGWIVGRPKSA
jgi:hypothetical protein